MSQIGGYATPAMRSMAEPAKRRRAGMVESSVADLLRRFAQPLTGHEITNRLRAAGLDLFPSQVFRAIDALRTADIVRRIELANRYTIGADKQSISLVCRACGGIEAIPSNGTAIRLAAVAATYAFVPSRYVVEVAGRCARCVNADPLAS